MTTEMILSGLFSIFSSFFGTFAGGGSAVLLLSFFLLTAQGSYLLFITLTKVSTLALALVSGNLHRKVTHLDWKLCFWMMLGGGTGVILSMYLLQYHLDQELLKKVVAVTLLSLCVYQAFFAQKILHPQRTNPFRLKEVLVTMLVFFLLNIIHGISGGMGFLFIAYSASFLRMSYTQAIAYSMISGIPILVIQTLYLVNLSRPSTLWMLLVVLGSILGAYFGTKFQYLKGDVWVKKASVVMMLVLGVTMLF